MNYRSQTPESEFDDHEVEISDLDANAFSLPRFSRWLNRFLQTTRRGARTRGGFALFCALALLLVCLLIVQGTQIAWPWSASVSRITPIIEANASRSLLQLIPTNQIAYIQTPDNTLIAYRATDGRLLWQRRLGGYASTIVNGQMLYCLVALKNGAMLEALNGQNGHIGWSQQLAVVDAAQGLLVEGDQIYINTRAGRLEVFRASDGRELWSYRDAREETLPLANFLTVEQNIAVVETPDGISHLLRARDGSEITRYISDGRLPLIEHGIIYLFLGFNSLDETDGTIQALRTSDGALLWRATLRVNQGWAPTAFAGTVYADSSDGAILALRGTDGRSMWFYKAQSPVVDTPAGQNGELYALLEDGSVIALRASSGALLWQTHIDALAHLSGSTLLLAGSRLFLSALEPQGNVVYALRNTDGHILWSHDMGSDNPLHAPVLFANIFYLSQNDGSLDAWRASDGAHLWHYAPALPIDWILPEETSGILYVKAFDNSIAVLQSSDGKLLWRYRPPGYRKAGSSFKRAGLQEPDLSALLSAQTGHSWYPGLVRSTSFHQPPGAPA